MDDRDVALNYRPLVIASLFVLMIFISGCVGSTKIDANNGLIVNEFSADAMSAEANDAVRFFLDVENVGGTTARCVTSELFGIESWYDIYGMQFSSLYPGYFSGVSVPLGAGRGLNFNYFNGNMNMCYTDYTQAGQQGGVVGQACVSRTNSQGLGLSGFIGQSFFDFSSQYCSNFASFDPSSMLVKYQPELAAPQPSLNKAGQSQTFEWILKPPVLPEGVSASYPITARTSYFYSTNAVMNVQSFNKAEFKRRADLGQQTAYPMVVQNSFGSPIQIFATRGSSPIVVNPDSLSGPLQYESYRFEFANLGDGFPLPMSGVDQPSSPSPETESGFLAAVLSVRGPGVSFSDCLGQQGTDIFINPQAIGNLIKVRADQRVPIGCTIQIDRGQWFTTPVGTITFTFSLDYRYYIDRTVNIQVTGVEGLSGRQIAGGY